jgi:hypothetical protein
VPDESSDKPESTEPNAPPEASAVGEGEASEAPHDATLDPTSPEAIAKRVAALGGDDEVERIARDEELKLAERRAKTSGGKKKSSLETAASKRLQQIGGRKAVPPKRVAIAADANPLLSGTGRFGEWVRNNQSLVLGGAIVAVAALVGAGGYVWWSQRAELGASTAITQAVDDELGRIGDPAKESDDDARPMDTRPVFKTDAERRDAALEKYKDVETKYKGTGAAYLARLEEGALLLDKADLDGAIAAFEDASKSPLAAADSEVKGRALEGLGLAYEAKARVTPAEKDKWLDSAAQQFRALENTDVKGFKELGMYDEARVVEAKGDKDKAITILKSLHERLEIPGENHPFVYLESVADDRLRALDPMAIKPKPKGSLGGPGGGAGDMNQEQINKLIEQLKAKGGGMHSPTPGGGK